METSTQEETPSLSVVGRSLNFTHFLQIQEMAPLEIAVPIYGYVLPAVVMVTVVTNSFIVLVLSQPQLRTPTNCILLAMAVMELLTGLVSFPWMLYYYTFGGHVRDARLGMPAFWCRTSMYFAELLPTVFHTSAIWLTVYLAMQRYWFVCSTSHRRSLPSGAPISIARCKLIAIFICLVAVLVELPMIFGKYAVPVPVNEYTFCTLRISQWVLKLGPNYFFSVYYWFMVIFVHAGPCTLLVVFGGLLIQTVHGAVKRRRESLGYLLRERDRSGASTTSSSMTATTKMLVVVIIIFLMTEIPAAVIFTLHVLHNTFQILPTDSYHSMNAALIFRNVFILISYPFNFAVYLSMSHQFRCTVRMIFCRQLSLFETSVTEAQRRSTYANGDAYSKANTEITQRCTSAFPASPSKTAISDRRQYCLAEDPFLRYTSGSTLDPPRRKSNAVVFDDEMRKDGQSPFLDQPIEDLETKPSPGSYRMTTTEYTATGEVRTSVASANGNCKDTLKKSSSSADQSL